MNKFCAQGKYEMNNVLIIILLNVSWESDLSALSPVAYKKKELDDPNI